MSSANQTVVCEEIFDEESHPSVEEIIEYATKIGIDPESEPQLLPLAAEGLMKALPPGWKPCYDEKNKSYYYYNNLTGKTQWEHPLDEIYRGIVVKKRAESHSISQGEPTEDATYTRDDLPSYEEPPHLSPFVPKTLVPLTLGARKKEIKLSPLKPKPKLADLVNKFSEGGKDDVAYPKLQKQKSEDRTGSGFTNRKFNNIHMFNSFDDKKEDSVSKSEFKLTGGGSMFLKSTTKKSESFTLPPQSKDNFLSPDAHNQPRGILRERSFLENSRSMEFPKSDKSDRDDDDKKSVRFNLDNPDITFDFSDKSLSDEELKDIKNEANEIINVSINNKPKSRFIVSPVKDLLLKYNEQETTDQDEQKQKDQKKLIKPNPKDFIKPKLKSSESQDNISDSEDDSLLKSAERDKKLGGGKNSLLESDNSLFATPEKDKNTFDASLLKKERENLQKEMDEKADREMEEIRKSIWEEKNEELRKYKQQIQQSQKSELERVLMAEKLKHEENVKVELDSLRKEMENNSADVLSLEKDKLEAQLENKKVELTKLFDTDEKVLEQKFSENLEVKKKNLEKAHRDKLHLVERELNEALDKHKDELIVSHNAILDEIKQKHNRVIEELKKDYRAEETIIRKEHHSQLADLKRKTVADIEAESNRSRDSGDGRIYEKIRCEKRLLEDKYRCLKDKYLRLKTDVKLSIEKRNRRREQSITTTGSETERSNSINKERSPTHSPSLNRRNPDKPPTPKHLRSNHDSHRLKPEHKTTRQLIIQDMDTSVSDHSYRNEDKYKNEDSSDSNVNPGRSRKKLFSRLKSSSTSRINTGTKSRKSQQRSCSPVENLRRQLQKLEDLEDEFPQNAAAHSDTYHLRYPFTDDQKFEGSSELEFFRHRIHLERDSIKRAKESLRSQKCLFQQRQKELKLKHGSMARHTLQQLCQEEKELTDMEVSLHRTRSLLGEKVIRLRHLEQSLHRASVTTNDKGKPDDATLSDLSSHSASSGISSTEFATADGIGGKAVVIKGEHFQESSEIIQSLENLNSEIREIWEVLHKQQQHAGSITSVVPPLPLVYPDLGWPVLAGTAAVPAPPSIPTLADRLHNYRQHIALANAQSTVVTHATQGATTTLVERTRNLRHWLRQAGIDPSNESNASQATL